MNLSFRAVQGLLNVGFCWDARMWNRFLAATPMVRKNLSFTSRVLRSHTQGRLSHAIKKCWKLFDNIALKILKDYNAYLNSFSNPSPRP